MDERYPDLDRRRRLLQYVYGRLVTSSEERWTLYRNDLYRLGAELGLNEGQSVRLLKSLEREGYLKTLVQANGNPFSESSSGFQAAYIEDLTDRGRRLIGVLPAVDSVEGIVASLEELARQIEANEALMPTEKERRIAALRGFVASLPQVAAQVGVQELMQALARAMPV